MSGGNKTILGIAVVSALGAAAVVSPVSAVILPDGGYNVYVNVTPTVGTAYGGTFYQVGKDGAWNSSFTFGPNLPSSASSQGHTNNGDCVMGSDSVCRGSSTGIDQYAGLWQIFVYGSSISVSYFSMDILKGTAFGDFAQYGSSFTHGISGTGTIDQTTGAMTLTPTGRMAAAGAVNYLFDKPWNVDDVDDVNSCMDYTCSSNGNAAWEGFTTGAANNGDPWPGYATETINGAPVTPLGDTDNDGLPDYSAILVSGGNIGTAWAGFGGVPYFEVYNVRLEIFTASTSFVPVPAAIWLFGSGLLGLGSLMRRKRIISICSEGAGRESLAP